MDNKQILASTISRPALMVGELSTLRTDPFAPRVLKGSKKAGGWKAYKYSRPYKGSNAAKRATRR